MATVAIGAAIGAMAGAGASADGLVALSITTAAIGGAIIGGGMGYMAEQSEVDSSGGVTYIDPNVADKSTPQVADQLDAAKIGGGDDAKKRKQAAKSKFKVDREEVITSTTGVTAPTVSAASIGSTSTGVQV